MEPKFQTSFIPKSPVGNANEIRTVALARSSNIFNVISMIIFMVVVFFAGGLFFYKNLLLKQIAEENANLTAARAAFEPVKIQELINASSRISSTKALLEKHVVVSELLTLLQKLTLKRINFTGLSYGYQNNIPTVSIEANAQSYNAIAQQENVFKQNEFIKNLVFSDFNLDANGGITMKFFAELHPELISYKELIQSYGINNTQ